LYHGRQREECIGLNIYFYKDKYVGPDVRKLSSIKNSEKYCILFVHPNPNINLNTNIKGKKMTWEEIIEKFSRRVGKGITIKEETKSIDYPTCLYIAKLKVSCSNNIK